MSDFRSVDLKFARAKQHLTAFEAELKTYCGIDPVRPVPQTRTDPRREPFNISVLRSPPDDLGLVFGDFVHNMRSTLDHLAMTLALDNGAEPHDSTIQFPICDNPDRYFGSFGKKTGERPIEPPRGTGSYSVRSLKREAQSFIEGLQPYNQGQNSWMLTELQFLDNMDKHRNTLSTKLLPSAMLSYPGVEIEWVSPVPDLVDGVHFATVVYPPDYSGVQVYPDFFARICVEHSSWPSGVNEAESFGRAFLVPHVEGIIDRAKTLFP